jgi:hypothetical protein
MPAVHRYFVDRLLEVEQLNASLHAEGPEKDSCIMVYGQQGIGKTQLLAKYLLDCNGLEVRVSHVDLSALVTKGYLGLIEALIEGLGSDGFEKLDETFDTILLKSRVERSQAILENAAAALPVTGSEGGQGITFVGPVMGQNQIFVNGNVSYRDNKIDNIFQIHLFEPEEMEELIQRRITRSFRECLQKITREQPVIILLDHWDNTNDLLRKWLEEHLLNWATDRTLRKVLVVLAFEALPQQFESRLGFMPMILSPFSREVALEFWCKNGLAESDFETIGPEIYSIPAILALEVGKQRFRQNIK